MSRISLAPAALAAVASCGVSQAALVAFWDFNALLPNPNTSHGIAADQGLGMLLADGTEGSSFWASTASNPQLTALGGFTDNALPGVVAGNSLTFANSSLNGAGSANGFSAVIKLDLTNVENLTVSYATRGSGSGTGFASQAWAISTDGVNFTALQTFTGTNASPVTVRSLGSLAAVDHASTAYLRVTFDGATASNGHNRIDNLLVQGDLVTTPAPGAAALVGVAGLLARRRRA